MLNRELFANDPTKTTIPNLGVAKIGRPTSKQEWDVLRYELTSFVCEGEYRAGLERILSTYLKNIDQPQQPAAWVSGFFGSGKSHLLRVLEALWTDTELPDGARARGLVGLPNDVTALLVELSTRGKQAGGLWSASGTLSSGAEGSLRLALLGLVFRAAGLPEDYQAARLVLWLRKNGNEAGVRQSLAERKKTLEGELPDMFVSTHLADSLLESIPSLAASPAALQDLLYMQFQPVSDVPVEQLVGTIDDVLKLQSSATGKPPCTLVVVDELQQYLGESTTRTDQVQMVIEACSARFGSRLLFVASGQSALQAHTMLQKLQGRFTVRVELQDRDVEQVVREVVLRKAPNKVPALKQVLDNASGEIARQLAGTAIGPRASDTQHLIADYPLLPVRRRFWENVIRAVDTAGASQLRTQLRVIHDAAAAVGDRPVGTVIAGDAIYDQQEENMVQGSALSQDAYVAIKALDDGTTDGRMRSRLCKLIFLIGKLPSQGIAATGLRATVDTLADLLVEDLTAGGAALRQRTPELLQGLVDSSALQLVDGEYLVQTPVGREWEQDFRQRLGKIRSDDGRIASDRDAAIRSALGKVLSAVKPTQGVDKTPRKVEASFGLTAPPVDTGAAPVWVRDGWGVAEGDVRQAAQTAGIDSPVVYLFLPRRDSDNLRDALARYAAATECIDQRPAPATAEGVEARGNMETKRNLAKQAIERHVQEILANSRVYQGGGNEIALDDISVDALQQALAAAVEAALVRLFPRFSQADQKGWDKVFDRATQGAADSLHAVGYTADAANHPVCQAVNAYIGPAGKRGADIRKQFTGASYGWPQDAVDGALAALVASGLVRVTRNGAPWTVKQLNRGQMSATDFYSDTAVVTTAQKIAVRGLLQNLGVPYKPEEEAPAIAETLGRMHALAAEAGGAPPRPEAPPAAYLADLAKTAGNSLILAVWTQRDQILADFKAWSRAKEEIAARMPQWTLLRRLLQHAKDLPVAQKVADQAAAIGDTRALLAEPDAVPPLVTQTAELLRQALQQKRQLVVETRATVLQALRATEEWQRLQTHDKQRLETKHQLDAVPSVDVGTDDALVQTLDATPLSAWETLAQALPTRATAARDEAVKLVRPEVEKVVPPAVILTTEKEVDTYLQQLRNQIMHHVKAGKPVQI